MEGPKEDPSFEMEIKQPVTAGENRPLGLRCQLSRPLCSWHQVRVQTLVSGFHTLLRRALGDPCSLLPSLWDRSKVDLKSLHFCFNQRASLYLHLKLLNKISFEDLIFQDGSQRVCFYFPSVGQSESGESSWLAPVGTSCPVCCHWQC